MQNKHDTLAKVFGHDVLKILLSVSNEKSFQHMKKRLSKKYPELAALDSNKDLVPQLTRALGIPTETLMYEIEKQALKSYLVNKNYQDIIEMLMDPGSSIVYKEPYCPNLKKHLRRKYFKLVVYTLTTAIRSSVLTVAIPGIPLLYFVYVFGLHPVYWMWLTGGISYWIGYIHTLHPKRQAKRVDKMYQILLRG